MNLFTRTFSKIFKSSNQQELDKIQNLILAVNNKENEIKSLSESQIKEKTANFKKNVQNGSIKLDDIIPESEFKKAGKVETNVFPSPVFISAILP